MTFTDAPFLGVLTRQKTVSGDCVEGGRMGMEGASLKCTNLEYLRSRAGAKRLSA